jgi:hypothetical protein
MQNVNRNGEPRNIDDSERARVFLDANLANARADARHRFPVIGIFAALHPIQLIPGLSTGRFWKPAQIIERTSPELNAFDFVHKGLYKILYSASRLAAHYSAKKLTRAELIAIGLRQAMSA